MLRGAAFNDIIKLAPGNNRAAKFSTRQKCKHAEIFAPDKHAANLKCIMHNNTAAAAAAAVVVAAASFVQLATRNFQIYRLVIIGMTFFFFSGPDNAPHSSGIILALECKFNAALSHPPPLSGYIYALLSRIIRQFKIYGRPNQRLFRDVDSLSPPTFFRA